MRVIFVLALLFIASTLAEPVDNRRRHRRRNRSTSTTISASTSATSATASTVATSLDYDLSGSEIDSSNSTYSGDEVERDDYYSGSGLNNEVDYSGSGTERDDYYSGSGLDNEGDFSGSGIIDH